VGDGHDTGVGGGHKTRVGGGHTTWNIQNKDIFFELHRPCCKTKFTVTCQIFRALLKQVFPSFHKIKIFDLHMTLQQG